METDYLAYYAGQSRMTDPGTMSGMLTGLPADLAELRRVVSGLVIHYRADKPVEQGVPEARLREIDSRYAQAMLARLAELADGPLAAPRPATARLVGCCRDFTVLFVGMARASGIPARARVGFATYFVPGYSVDHEVAEVWDAGEQRWRLIDAETADGHAGPDGVAVDPFDLPRDRFLVAGEAWLRCRTGEADPATFVVDPELDIPETRGWPQIRHNLVQDVAALNKTEMLLWDAWALRERESLTKPDVDGLAGLTAAADPDVTALRTRYQADPALRVPDTVLSHDPLGGPPREVTWRLSISHSLLPSSPGRCPAPCTSWPTTGSGASPARWQHPACWYSRTRATTTSAST